MKALVSNTAFIIISVGMMLIGVTADALAWLGLIAKDEPPLVVHLSTFALIFSGYGNVITALVNRHVKDNNGRQ